MKKILVIEDRARAREPLLTGLKAQGFSPISAENGRVGIQRAQEKLPDLIVCDILMPENGYEVLATLRQNSVTATIPFIVVTAKEDRADRRKAMEMGVDDYLTLPFTLEELQRAIAAQLKKYSLLRQGFAADRAGLVPQPPLVISEASVIESQSIFPSVPHLDAVFDFIEGNYHLAITLEDVAQAVGYSPSYLTNLTKRRTGKTVQRWIIERRMAAARSLLLETNLTVEQIAIQVGYQNVVHFFRQFRQLHGTTPQAWRNTSLLAQQERVREIC